MPGPSSRKWIEMEERVVPKCEGREDPHNFCSSPGLGREDERRRFGARRSISSIRASHPRSSSEAPTTTAPTPSPLPSPRPLLTHPLSARRPARTATTNLVPPSIQTPREPYRPPSRLAPSSSALQSSPQALPPQGQSPKAVSAAGSPRFPFAPLSTSIPPLFGSPSQFIFSPWSSPSVSGTPSRRRSMVELGAVSPTVSECEKIQPWLQSDSILGETPEIDRTGPLYSCEADEEECEALRRRVDELLLLNEDLTEQLCHSNSVLAENDRLRAENARLKAEIETQKRQDHLRAAQLNSIRQMRELVSKEAAVILSPSASPSPGSLGFTPRGSGGLSPGITPR